MDPDKTCGKPQKVQVVQHSFAGGLWFAAWLFTIGFLKLAFWQGVWAVILWPYYLGMHYASR